MIAHDRALGARVYDAVKQIPAFIRLVASTKHEAVVRQVRATDQPAVVAGGYGIRIDNPQEEKFRAAGIRITSPNSQSRWVGVLESARGDDSRTRRWNFVSDHIEMVAGTEMDEANPDKTGAYGLTLVDEEARVANYKKTAPLTEPGDLVLVDFLTLHRSGKNVSDRSRWSLQLRWFNFVEPTGRKLGWPGAYAAGKDLRAVHPELVVD